MLATLLLAALSQETVIYEKPDRSTKKLGILRTGALVNRAALPIGKRGCKGGWYRVAPEGYVCVGRAATLDVASVSQLKQSPDLNVTIPEKLNVARFLDLNLVRSTLLSDIKVRQAIHFGIHWNCTFWKVTGPACPVTQQTRGRENSFSSFFGMTMAMGRELYVSARQLATSCETAASTSASVVWRPSVRRTAPRATFGGTPISSSTCAGCSWPS